MVVTQQREAVIIDELMNGLPYAERRWCGMPGCECSGCASSVVSRNEWLAWFARQQSVVCDRCERAVWALAPDGQSCLACETCDMFWS